MFRNRELLIPRLACGLLLIGGSLMLSGCNKVDAKKDAGKPAPPAGENAIPSVSVVTVEGKKHIEHIELPGASVHGMESTPLMSKAAGFVGSIRRYGETMYQEDRYKIQITDMFNAQTRSATDLLFRVIDTHASGAERTKEYRFTNSAEFKKTPTKPQDVLLRKVLSEAYSRALMLEVDVGSVVKAGALLAELDIPEMKDDIKKQEAEIARTNAIVNQMVAARKVADEKIKQRGAEKQKAVALKTLAEAERDKFAKKLERIETLAKRGGVERDILLEAQFEAAAARAAVTSAAEEINSAISRIAVAAEMAKKAQQDVKAADADVDVAKAVLSKLKTMDRYRFIRAPYNGTITRRMVDHGAFVRPATSNSGAMPLFEITRLDKVRVVIPVPGRNSYKIKPGQKAVFHTIGGLPGMTVQGTITRSADTLDMRSRMLRVEMYLDNPVTDARLMRKGRAWTPRKVGSKRATSKETRKLRPGMFGTITLVKNWPNLRTLPSSAVSSADGQSFVYEVIDGPAGKQIVVRRYITVVLNDAKTVGIIGEFDAKARIVSANVNTLKDGQTVTVNSQ